MYPWVENLILINMELKCHNQLFNTSKIKSNIPCPEILFHGPYKLVFWKYVGETCTMKR